MKLDRNENANGLGKYAILKLRVMDECRAGTFGKLSPDIVAALEVLESHGILDWGVAGTEAEFFLIRLKDKYAQTALQAYSLAAAQDDPEYAAEITEMATRAGPASPFCKKPD